MSGWPIAVIGLGRMGLGMAARLAASGYVTSGFDPSAEQTAAASRLGVTAASDPGAAMRDCPLVLLSLPHARAVWSSVEAFVGSTPERAVLVDTSTLAVADSRALAAHVGATGRDFLDAPVSGGPAGAASGSLTMMIGGPVDVLARVRPAIEVLTARIVHVGGHGAGQVAKLANNMLVATHLMAAAEAMRMVQAAGVDVHAVLDVVNAASGRSAATEVNLPRWILSGAFDSGFTAALMRKDVALAMELAHCTALASPVLAAAARRWLDESGAVPGDADFNRVAAWAMSAPVEDCFV